MNTRIEARSVVKRRQLWALLALIGICWLCLPVVAESTRAEDPGCYIDRWRGSCLDASVEHWRCKAEVWFGHYDEFGNPLHVTGTVTQKCLIRNLNLFGLVMYSREETESESGYGEVEVEVNFLINYGTDSVICDVNDDYPISSCVD